MALMNKNTGDSKKLINEDLAEGMLDWQLEFFISRIIRSKELREKADIRSKIASMYKTMMQAYSKKSKDLFK